MLKSIFAATASLAILAGAPAFAGEPVQIAATEAITSEQAGRIVMQGGEAIGTLTEVMADDNLAVISLTDGSEKQVALTDLSVTADGSIEYLAMASVESESSTYE
ncbi:MAG: hypothetical protein AAF607_05980 [Pseudomonadota bacterium]